MSNKLTSIVPCDGCVLCCQGESITMQVGDNPSLYLLEPTPTGELQLKHKANGDCVYLNGTTCSIYDKRPILCRFFDCRKFAVQVSISPELAGGDIKSAVLERGRELLRKC